MGGWCGNCRYFHRCENCQANLKPSDLLRYKLSFEDDGGRIGHYDFTTLKEAEAKIAQFAANAEEGYQGIVLYEIKELFRGDETDYKEQPND